MRKFFVSLGLVVFLATPVLADGASMDGSYVELIGPPVGIIGETVEVEVWHWNGSVDNEWTAAVVLTWPACVEVLNGWFVYEGDNPPPEFAFEAAGSEARFTDGDGGYGEIFADDGVSFFVEILVTEACVPTVQIVDYLIEGDVFGAPPHAVTGFFEFPVEEVVAAESSTWTTVKGQYR